MNYKLHYDKLIERAKSRKLQGYKEKHHIIPRSIGGTDNKDNLVNLTAREHFIAHILLVKIYPEEKGLINAVNMMCRGQDERKIHNRMYGWLKERFTKRMSNLQSGKGNSQFGTMWITKDKENKKIKKEEFDIYKDLGWEKGRKNVISEDGKNKLRKANINKKVSIETKLKMSKANNTKHSNETKLKIGKAFKGKIYISSIKEKLNKTINKEELSYYESIGWEKGRKNFR